MLPTDTDFAEDGNNNFHLMEDNVRHLRPPNSRLFIVLKVILLINIVVDTGVFIIETVIAILAFDGSYNWTDVDDITEIIFILIIISTAMICFYGIYVENFVISIVWSIYLVCIVLIGIYMTSIGEDFVSNWFEINALFVDLPMSIICVVYSVLIKRKQNFYRSQLETDTFFFRTLV